MAGEWSEMESGVRLDWRRENGERVMVGGR